MVCHGVSAAPGSGADTLANLLEEAGSPASTTVILLGRAHTRNLEFSCARTLQECILATQGLLVQVIGLVKRCSPARLRTRSLLPLMPLESLGILRSMGSLLSLGRSLRPLVVGRDTGEKPGVSSC